MFDRIQGGLFEAGRQMHFILYPGQITVKKCFDPGGRFGLKLAADITKCMIKKGLQGPNSRGPLAVSTVVASRDLPG